MVWLKHLKTRNNTPFAGQIWKYGVGPMKGWTILIQFIWDGRIYTTPDTSYSIPEWKAYVKKNRMYREF